MALSTEQIREKYHANQLFLIGDKLDEGLEIIDRRANYVVAVDAEGKDRKLFLDEAYRLHVQNPNATKPTKAHVKSAFDAAIDAHTKYGGDSKEYKEAAAHHEKLYLAHKAVPQDVLDRLQVEEYSPENLPGMDENVRETPQKRANFSTFSSMLSEDLFTYKGFRGTQITKNVECANTFHGLVEECDDPWALLAAIRATEAFFEHRTPGTLERARTAVARIDDIDNHPWLILEGSDPAQIQTENKSIFTIKATMELLDEDCDFEIQETLTYSGFRTVLTEDFERDVHKQLAKLEKNPSELDELTHHVRTIADIAHHYDKHSVHMKEDAEDKAIQHAEKTKRISVRKLSSGPQLVKVAKRAAVELIAQKLAKKPIKKISKKEKNVIIDAIKKKKGVVLKLAKKLIPKIKAIEYEHHEHDHESRVQGTDSKGEFGSAGG